MKRESIATGKTIDDAKAAACKELGVSPDSVDITSTILEMPSKGFLGFGASPAKVKVEIEIDEKVKEEVKPVKEIKREVKEIREVKKEVKEQPKETKKTLAQVQGSADAQETVVDFLENILKLVGMEDSKIDAVQSERELKVNITGPNMGVIIGRRGETLDALQTLANIIVNNAVNKEGDKHIRLFLDTENYRAKREETLVSLANKVADRVVKYHKSVTLEPMSSYERRIIHATLQTKKNIATHSVGRDPDRKVVIVYKA